MAKLKASGSPITVIKAVPPDQMFPSVSLTMHLAFGMLAQGACLLLTSNLWVEEGLVNGAMGILDAIYYNSSNGPFHFKSYLTIAIMVRFDGYSGPTLPDGIVPTCPIHKTWS